jgi:predicted outer membrane protein
LFVVKVLAVALACGVAAGLALAAMWATRSAPLALAVASGVLALEAAALVPLVALAFGRFDPSRDTPP